MNRKEVQKRTLQFGKPLALDKFEWDEVNKEFSTEENDVILDFRGIEDATFIGGDNCVLVTDNDCKFGLGKNSVFKSRINRGFELNGNWIVLDKNTGGVIEVDEEGSVYKLIRKGEMGGIDSISSFAGSLASSVIIDGVRYKLVRV